MPLVGPARPRRSPVTAAQASLLVRGDAHPFAPCGDWGSALVGSEPVAVAARLLGAPPDGFELREEPIALERLEAAEEILLRSAVRGVHPGALPGQPPRFEAGDRLAEAVLS